MRTLLHCQRPGETRLKECRAEIRHGRTGKHTDCFTLVRGPADMVGGIFNWLDIRLGASWLHGGEIFAKDGKRYLYRNGNLYKMD